MHQRFHLRRTEDVNGVSGTGTVVEGVRFSDGIVAIRWISETSSIAIYKSVDDLMKVHGHEGRTVLVPVD